MLFIQSSLINSDSKITNKAISYLSLTMLLSRSKMPQMI